MMGSYLKIKKVNIKNARGEFVMSFPPGAFMEATMADKSKELTIQMAQGMMDYSDKKPDLPTAVQRDFSVVAFAGVMYYLHIEGCYDEASGSDGFIGGYFRPTHLEEREGRKLEIWCEERSLPYVKAKDLSELLEKLSNFKIKEEYGS